MSTTAQLMVGGERTTGESIRSQNGERRRHHFILSKWSSTNLPSFGSWRVSCIVFKSLPPFMFSSCVTTNVSSHGCNLRGQHSEDLPGTSRTGQDAGG